MKFKKSIICLILFCATITMFMGCGKDKTPITNDKFIEVMEEKSFEIIDASDQFPDNKEDINNVTIAICDKFQIEFYDFATKKTALSSFNLNKSNFEKSKGNTSKESSISIANYGKYSLTTNGQYYYVSYIDNTMIYVVVSDEFKGEVSKIIDELGY